STVPGDFTVTVDWGDQQTSSGTVSANPNGSFDVTASHSYADSGIHSMTISVADSASSASDSAAAVVIAAAVEVTANDISATQDQLFSGVVATFISPDANAQPNDFDATVFWGDGASDAGTITANQSGGFDISASHTYAYPGGFPLFVSVLDPGGNQPG